MDAIQRFHSIEQFEDKLYGNVYNAIFKLWLAEARAIASTNNIRGEEETHVYQQIQEFFTPEGHKELIRKKANKYIDFKTTYYNMSLFGDTFDVSHLTDKQKEDLIEKVNECTDDLFYLTNKLSNYFTFFYDENYVLVIDVTFLGNREELTDLEKYEIHVYVEDQHDNLPF